MHNATFKMRTLRPAAAGKAAAFAFCILHLALLAGACAKAQANAAPDGPPLAVPAPPPRVLAPVSAPLAENVPEPEPETTPPRTTPRTQTPPPRRPPTTATAPVEEPKPDTPPAQTPAVSAEPPVAPRPVPAQADAVAERRVREMMRVASADLNRVDYRRLSPDGKKQYDQSKRFNEQAEEALKDRNYPLATTVAEKAQQIATELLAR